jgi:predicted O-methyltransferase YrrM
MILNRPSLQNLVGKKDLVGAEIGVYLGHNAKDILEKLDIKKIYLIDRNLGKSKKYLQEYKDKIVWLQGLSDKVAEKIPDESLDFAYVDGGHKEPIVLKDLKVYYPKIKPGGLICGHDYMKQKKLGVVEAVNSFFVDKEIHTGECLDSKRPEGKKHQDWWVWKDE